MDGAKRVIELRVRFRDVPTEDRDAYSERAQDAMWELADSVKAILEKHGLGYRGVGYGIPRGTER